MVSTLFDLDRRLSRKIEAGRGINLSASDLDWFTVTGGYATLTRARIAEDVQAARQRLEAAGADLSSINWTAAVEGRPLPTPAHSDKSAS
jgi:hypothetical protein